MAKRPPREDFQRRIERDVLAGWRGEAERTDDPTERAWTLHHIPRLVIEQIARGEDPNPDDLALALVADPDQPAPAVLQDYVARVYVRQSRPRSTTPYSVRSPFVDVAALAVIADRKARGWPQHRAVAAAVEHLNANGVSIEPRTVERIYAEARARLQARPQP